MVKKTEPTNEGRDPIQRLNGCDGKEMRVLSPTDVEMRIEDGEQPKIVGYAAKFGKWSEDLGGFREKIKVGAFDEALEVSDVRALKNHDANLLLGRTPKTCRLTTNSVGLRFEIDVPDTTTGRDTLEEIRRGDLTGCSFAFRVSEDDWKYKEDGTIERTLVKIEQLFDVGPVTYPAYPDTSVAARSLDDFMAKFGMGPKYVPTPPQKHECPRCHKQIAEYKEVHPDTDINEIVLMCPECGEVDEPQEPQEVSPEQQRQINAGYRKAGRILNRCRASDD